MKLKFKNILLISLLAVAGIFGTASAVLNQKVNEEPVVEKAEAYNQTVKYGVFVKTGTSGTQFAALSFDSTTGKWTGSGIIPANTNFYIYAYGSNKGDRQIGYCGENKGGLSNTNYISHDSGRNAAIHTTDKAYFSFSLSDADISDYGDVEWIWQTNSSITGTAVYTVTYNANGHGTAPSSQDVVSGSTTTNPGRPTGTVIGYSFGGWYKEDGCTNAWDFGSDTVTSNKTLYAKWTAGEWTSHTVYYANSSANSYSTIDVRVNRGGDTGKDNWFTHTFSKTTYKYGSNYVFSGTVEEFWGGLDAMYFKKPGTGSSDLPSDVLSTAFTTYTLASTFDGKLYDGSSWKTVYKVDFNANGHGTAPNGQYVVSGGKASKPTAPTATGYTFGGWYKEDGCTNAWTFNSDTVTSNKTLYAKWTANNYSITYKDQGNNPFSGTHASGYPTSHTYGTATTLKTATKDGYNFDGWFTTSACTGDAVTSLGATAYTAAITLYAKWSAASATITFDKQSGTGGSDSVTATYGSAMPSATMPTRDGYNFAGYWTAPGGSGTKYYNADGTSARNWDGSGDTPLYANWSPKTYTIALNNQSATTAGATSVTATFAAAMPSIASNLPAKTGYTFGGYYTETGGNGTKYINANGTSAHVWDIDEEISLYAKWTINTYTVIYTKSDQASVSQQKTHGTNYTILAPGTSPLNDSGWTTASDYKSFSHWSGSDGNDYVPGDAYTTNEALTLTFVEDWYLYQYRVNEGSWIDLVANDNDLPESVIMQFAPTSAKTLPLNGMLEFRYSTDRGSNWNSISPSYTGDKNNYDPVTGIKLATVDTIYLKLTTSGTYDCWVPGISDYTLRVGGTTSYTLRGAGTSPYSGKEQMVATSLVEMRVGQTLEVGLYGSSFWAPTYLETGCQGVEISGGSVVCTETGAYTIYLLKSTVSQNWTDISVTRDNAASANYFARLFNESIGSICDPLGNTTNKTNLQNAWGTTSSSGFYKDYNSQDSDVKALYVQNSSDSDIRDFYAKYKYILEKYTTSTVPNFLGISFTPRSAIRDFSPFNLIGGEDNFSTIIIIISSSVALLSVTALSILVIRKRKSKEIE